MSAADFDITDTTNGRTLAFQGRLDSAACAGLHARVLEQIADVQAGQSLRFDLAGSDFVASAFLRLCVIAARELGRERFAVTNLAPLVREVFTMAGLDRHLALIERSSP